MYLIYAHINKLNNKYYVGQTRLKSYHRWRKGFGYKNQPKFWRAIVKYGWSNFDHKILENCDSLETANKREQYWIDYYDSINNGYNCSIGGGVPQYFAKAVLQLDVNKNILNKFNSTREAERLTGISQANISHCCLGKTNSANGYYWCYETDYDSYICKSIGPSKGQPKQVYCFDLDNNLVAQYESASAAELATNIPHQNISKCCLGKLGSAGGFIWRYINE